MWFTNARSSKEKEEGVLKAKVDLELSATFTQSISAPAKSGAALRGRSGLTFRSGAQSSAPTSAPTPELQTYFRVNYL